MVKNAPPTADQELVRRLNTAHVLNALRSAGSLSRARLAGQTGLTRSTTSSIISDLLARGLVHETILQTSTNGRPGMLLEIDPLAGCSIGVDLNIDYISVLLTDFRANTLWRARAESSPNLPEDEILAKAEGMIDQALTKADALAYRKMGIGVGLPGLVETGGGRLVLAPTLHWRNLALQDRWRRRFELPVYVENEANAATLGEHYLGAAQGTRHAVYFSIGAGVGGGILSQARLWRGARGFGGQVGHVSIDPVGADCVCGRKGCWSTFVTLPAIRRRIARGQAGGDGAQFDATGAPVERWTFRQIEAMAAAGHGPTLAALRETADYLAIGFVNIANVLDPELMILGGSIVPLAFWLMPRIEERVRAEALFGASGRQIRLAVSQLRDDACVLGAATLVLDAVLQQPALAGQAERVPV